MKKLIALLAVCGFALAFVACGKKAEPAAEAVDSRLLLKKLLLIQLLKL